MTIKLCLRPTPDLIRPSNGIGRIVHAQYEMLQNYGFEFVRDPVDADLCIGHTQRHDMPRVDVLCIHGLYWIGDIGSGIYGGYELRANSSIIESIRMAHTITVPSRWVAMPFKRDMRINPAVIGHGIHFNEWQPGKPEEWALWNKNRAGDVCDPIAAYELAKRGLNIVSTFAPRDVTIPKNMEVIGSQPADLMKQIIERAGVYLSTVRETFGIGTLEAMACGVPVVGWNYGGTQDIITHGYDGLLVKPGDYDELYAAVVEAYQRRDELGTHARETASHYDWPLIMQKYSDLFTRTYEAIKGEKHGLSIVITNHNYAAFVGDAIKSALNQTRKPDELIIVDDGSTDDSSAAIQAALVDRRGDDIRVISQSNQGVAAARTAGIAAATQPYITCLDADDLLDPQFIEKLLPAIDARRDLGIVYSSLMLFNDQNHWLSDGFPQAFEWEKQARATNPPSNCVPSACIFRKAMWFRAGPHKQEYAPGEDAEFWTRGLSIGFDALKASDEGLAWYRMHGDSASRRLKYKPIDDRLPWLRDYQYPLAAPSKYAALVRSYSDPKVSIIISLEDGQANLINDAIDSVLGQTMREWELIVVDNCATSDTARYVMARYPFVTLVKSVKRATPGALLNAGLEQAHAALAVFMTAAQRLAGSALEEMMTAHLNNGGRYVYADSLAQDVQGEAQTHESGDYAQIIWQKPLHSLPALIPSEWALAVKFDGNLKLGVVQDFYSRMAIAGYCGQRLGRALIVDLGKASELPTRAKAVLARHLKGLEGRTMGSCCGGNAAALLAAKQAISDMTPKIAPEGKVGLQYVGPSKGTITYTVNGRSYRVGDNDVDRIVYADPRDSEMLMRMAQCRPISIVS